MLQWINTSCVFCSQKNIDIGSWYLERSNVRQRQSPVVVDALTGEIQTPCCDLWQYWPGEILINTHTRMVYNEHLLSLTTQQTGNNDYQELILGSLQLTTNANAMGGFSWARQLLYLFSKYAMKFSTPQTAPIISPQQSSQPCTLIWKGFIDISLMQCLMPKPHSMLASAKRFTSGCNHI